MASRAHLTSLTEDLKDIGLFNETDDQEQDAPKPDPEGGEVSDEGEETPVDEPDEPKDAAEAFDFIASRAQEFLASHGPKAAKPDAPAPAQTSESRLQRLADGRLYEDAPTGAPTSHSNRAQSLLEEVNEIVTGIKRSRREEQIKGFANIAVIAETLGKRFTAWGMEISERGMYEVGQQMKKLSEQAADTALALDQGEEPPMPPPEGEEPDGDEAPLASADGDDAQVDVMFKKLMAKLLDALQLYNDVTGKEDEMPPEGEEEPTEEPPAEEPPTDEPPMGETDGPPGTEEPPEGNGEDDDEEEDDDEDDEVGVQEARRRKGKGKKSPLTMARKRKGKKGKK